MKISHRGAGETKNAGTREVKGELDHGENERRKEREKERERERGKKKEGEEGEREEKGRETGKESHQESEELTKDEGLLTETFAL